MENTPAKGQEAKNPPPVLSSAGDNALTLWHNPAPQSDSHPDLTGTVTVDGEKLQVSGWLIAPGKTAEGKAYGAFVGLRLSRKLEDGTYANAGTGALSGMNTYKGQPVDETHRSRVIANLKVGDKDVVVNSFATKQLQDNPDLAAKLGFTGPIVAETPKAEQEQAQSRSRGARP